MLSQIFSYASQLGMGSLIFLNYVNILKKNAHGIDKLSKIIENIEIKINETQDNDEEYDKSIDRIEKIKQDRQKDIENDKKWSEMEDDNDELIGRINRLKPAEIVEGPDLDIYEMLDKEDEEELEKDKYFEEREREDQFNRIEPVELDPDFEFEELNKHANELLFSRARMKKKGFAKKIAYIFSI